MGSKLGIVRVADQSADVMYTQMGQRVYITNLDGEAYDVLSESPFKKNQITLELGDGQVQEIVITQANRNALTKIFHCEADLVA